MITPSKVLFRSGSCWSTSLSAMPLNLKLGRHNTFCRSLVEGLAQHVHIWRCPAWSWQNAFSSPLSYSSYKGETPMGLFSVIWEMWFWGAKRKRFHSAVKIILPELLIHYVKKDFIYYSNSFSSFGKRLKTRLPCPTLDYLSTLAEDCSLAILFFVEESALIRLEIAGLAIL